MKKIYFVEFKFKTGKKSYRFPIESFQYFDYTIQETKYKLSPKENKVYDTLMINFLNILWTRNPKIVNEKYEIVEDLKAVDHFIEFQNINEIVTYDEFHQEINTLKVIHNWIDNKKNDFQKTYLFKSCLGINVKRNNDKD